jgi:hypothetical protein
MAIHQLGRFKEVLDIDVARARQMLRNLLRDKEGRFVPIKLTPVEHNGRKTFVFEGQILAGAVFNNLGEREPVSLAERGLL